MNFNLFVIVLLPVWREIEFAGGTKFNAETFSGISVLSSQGKNHLDSLTDKANVSRYGTCWRNAITELQVGCKFLSEDVQKNLALKLTDCFLQMSGYEPMKCDFPESVCLQNLSDRAFNAYTEFYTHTHSICYFLQSQVWQEEAERTVNKLSTTSTRVSEQLLESERMQKNLLNQQKESLSLQHDLIENSQGIASTLQSSQDNIKSIMEDFQSSTSEQRQILLDVFENLSSLRSWAINEMSWFSSSVFFLGATIISFIFTSVSRTRSARMYILLIFSLNFLFERFIATLGLNNVNSQVNLIVATDTLYAWIWLLRKFCILLSIIVIIYAALSYYDYNMLNYQLLLEIKNQNARILNHFDDSSKHQKLTGNSNRSHELMYRPVGDRLSSGKTNVLRNHPRKSIPSFGNRFGLDELDHDIDVTISISNVSEKEKKSEAADSVSVLTEKSDDSVHSGYNLRSGRMSKVPLV